MLKSSVFFCALICLHTIVFSQNTILWKITSPNSTHTSYLLGTNHIMGEGFVDSFPVINQKIQSSDVVITETEMNKKTIEEMYKGKPESDSAYIVLSPQDAALVEDIFKQKRDYIKKLTAGELYLKLQLACVINSCTVVNKNSKYRMDQYIQLLGKQYHKSLYHFETDIFQLSLLDTGITYYNWNFIKRNAPIVLNMYRHPNNLICMQMNKYASLTVDYKFNEECSFINSKAMSTEVFIKERNENWLKQLPPLLQGQNCFIAVGLAHLFNRCGLIKRLEQMGYTVEPVEMKAGK